MQKESTAVLNVPAAQLTCQDHAVSKLVMPSHGRAGLIAALEGVKSLRERAPAPFQDLAVRYDLNELASGERAPDKLAMQDRYLCAMERHDREVTKRFYAKCFVRAVQPPPGRLSFSTRWVISDESSSTPMPTRPPAGTSRKRATHQVALR